MSVADLMYVAVVIFAVAIVFGVVFMVQAQLFPALRTQLNSNDPNVNAVISSAQSVFPLLDYVFVIAFFGAMVGILILAYALPTSPIFIGINLIAMMVVFLVMPPLTNSYMSIAAALPGVDVSVSYPYTFLVMQNYPLFVMAFGFALLVVLVAKFRSDSNDL